MDLKETADAIDHALVEQEMMIVAYLENSITPEEGRTLTKERVEYVQSKCICAMELVRYVLHAVLLSQPADTRELRRRMLELMASEEGAAMAGEVLQADARRISKLSRDLTIEDILESARQGMDDFVAVGPPLRPHRDSFTMPARSQSDFAADGPGLAL